MTESRIVSEKRLFREHVATRSGGSKNTQLIHSGIQPCIQSCIHSVNHAVDQSFSYWAIQSAPGTTGNINRHIHTYSKPTLNWRGPFLYGRLIETMPAYSLKWRHFPWEDDGLNQTIPLWKKWWFHSKNFEASLGHSGDARKPRHGAGRWLPVFSTFVTARPSWSS